MKTFRLKTLLALLMFSAALSPLPSLAADAMEDTASLLGKHEHEWRACHSDDDCALVRTTSECAVKLAVNRDHFEEASAYASQHDACKSPVPEVKGTDYSTRCQQHQCVLLKTIGNP